MTETVVSYEPRGAAAELFRARESEVALSGPAGTGKSLVCLFRLHLVCLQNPGIRCLIVRKTAVSLGSTTLVTFEKKVAEAALRSGLMRWYGGSAREAAAYKYSNGSVIVVGGMDRPEKVLSSEYDLVFADEATELTETDWETLGTRLRHGVLAWQQQMAACNPSYPTHWLKLRANRGALRMLHSRHIDNPAYVNADGSMTEQGAAYLAKLDNLTGVRRDRLRDGKWAAAEGMIFERWDERVHLIDPFPIPREWQRWWAVDFGFTNPTSVIMAAEDPDGRLYVYRELYATKKTVAEHGDDILKVVADPDPERPGRWIWREPKPRAIICDHDAEGRVVLSQKVGIGTIAAKKGVTDGIQAVQERLKLAGDGKPRLFVMRDTLVARDRELVNAARPTCLAEEIPAYIWEMPGASAASQAPKERPLKDNDHACDALRYLCAEREIGAPRMRTM